MTKRGYEDFEITVTGQRTKLLGVALMVVRFLGIAVIWPLCQWGVEITKAQASQAGEMQTLRDLQAQRYLDLKVSIDGLKSDMHDQFKDLNQKVYDLKGKSGP